MINFTLASDFDKKKSAKNSEPLVFQHQYTKNIKHIANHFSALLL